MRIIDGRGIVDHHLSVKPKRVSSPIRRGYRNKHRGMNDDGGRGRGVGVIGRDTC